MTGEGCGSSWSNEVRRLHDGRAHECTRRVDHPGRHVCDCGREIVNAQPTKEHTDATTE